MARYVDERYLVIHPEVIDEGFMGSVVGGWVGSPSFRSAVRSHVGWQQ